MILNIGGVFCKALRVRGCRFATNEKHEFQGLMVDFADFDTTIDLHGEFVEEGIERLERFLDRAMLSIESEVKVIHGHGGGQLKSAVRTYLKTSPYVSSARSGDPWEGGDAVTIVTLKLDR